MGVVFLAKPSFRMLSSLVKNTLLQNRRNVESTIFQSACHAHKWRKGGNKYSDSSTDVKSVIIKKITVHNHDLDYRAKSLAKWLTKNMASEIIFKPRGGINPENEEKMKSLEEYVKLKVDELTEQAVESKTTRSKSLVKISFVPPQPKTGDPEKS